MTQQEIVRPTPKQAEMLSSPARELLWYGSRAGGKSFTTYFAPLYYIQYPDFTGLVLRTSFADLNDYLNAAKRFYEPIGGKVTFGGSPKIQFPSGATIFVSYLKDSSSLEKHKGKNLSMIIFEELSQLPSEDLYEKLLASLRTTNQNITPQMIATTNPDGAGARWVYDRWDIGNPDKQDKIWTTSDGTTRHAIKSSVLDNPYTMQNDPEYVKYLRSLKGNLYKQWYLGEFIFTASKEEYYHQYILDIEQNNQIKDFYIEPSIPVNTAWDLGMNDSTTIVLYQIYGQEIRVVDFYENNNESIQHYINWLFDWRQKNNISFGNHILPHDVEVRELSTGKSRKQTFIQMGLNPIIVAPRESLHEGINAVRNIIPRCYFHKTNTAILVEYLKKYRKEFDSRTQNYRNQPFHGPESHAADAFRYMALAAREHKPSSYVGGQFELSFS